MRSRAPSTADPPGYTVSAVEPRPLGSRQSSRRFQLQTELSISGDDEQKAVARQELAKQLRMCDLGAMRTHTLKQVQHPLSPRYIGSAQPSDGWRHLPHDPEKPIALGVPASLRPQPTPQRQAYTARPATSGAMSGGSMGGSSCGGAALASSFAGDGGGGDLARARSARGARGSDAFSVAEDAPPRNPRLSMRSPRNSYEVTDEHSLFGHGTPPATPPPGGGSEGLSSVGQSLSSTLNTTGGFSHQLKREMKLAEKAAQAVIDARYRGPVRHYNLEDVYAAAANSKELYTLLYGRRPDSPPSSSAFDPPPDRIKPGAFGSRPRPPEATGNYLKPKEKATPRSARVAEMKRAREEAESRDGNRGMMMMTNDECERQFQETSRLPPHKRVERRLELLREQPYLRNAVARRAEQHKHEMHAALKTDFIALNGSPDRFTKAGEQQRQERTRAMREKHAQRAVHAREVAEKGQERDIGLTSEALTKARLLGRQKHLRRGWCAFLAAQREIVAKTWAIMVRMARGTQSMRGITKLGRIMNQMRQTSRLERTVRTLQRQFRKKKMEKEGRNRMAQIIAIQRHIRQWVFMKKKRELGAAVDIIKGFFESAQRLTPMEMAIKRYSTRVRVMQNFIRGAQAITKGKLILLQMQWKKLETARLVADFGHTTKGAKVQRGQYAGVPEDMLDLPMPHVPEEMRNKILRGLLSDMKRKHIEEQILWDQKVLLKAEQHPALIGGERGVQKLVVIQHDLQKDSMAKRKTSKFSAVSSILDNISTNPDQMEGRSRRSREVYAESSGGVDPASPLAKFGMSNSPAFARADAKNSITGKLKNMSNSVSAQRAALDEIRRSIPRPFVHMLVPRETLLLAFERVHNQCNVEALFESRSIKPAKRQSSASKIEKRTGFATPDAMRKGPSSGGLQRQETLHFKVNEAPEIVGSKSVAVAPSAADVLS